MMESLDAQRVIASCFKNAIVVTTRTTSREWPYATADKDLHLSCGPMGKASSLGLGLALARPERKVIVLDGDGSLLMNLGSLVTVANMKPRNLVHFVFENEVYRTTGGQPVPCAGKISFKRLAKACGFAHAHEFETLEQFASGMDRIRNQAGPVFVCLKVPPATECSTLPMPGLAETREMIVRFMKELNVSGNAQISKELGKVKTLGVGKQ